MSAAVIQFPARQPSRPPAIPCYECDRVVPNDPEECLAHLIACEAGDTRHIDRDEAIKRIRAGLKKRSGKAWSVTGGRGTAWGWIQISAPPRRCSGFGYMNEADMAELGKLLGKDRPAHIQGEKVPSSGDYYSEYVARAEGRTPTVYGQQYWD